MAEIPRSLSLREATYQILRTSGTGILRQPERFLGSLLDLVEADSALGHLLAVNCDREFMDVFADAAEEGTPDAIGQAFSKATLLLRDDRLLQPEAARNVSAQIAFALAASLGLRASDDVVRLATQDVRAQSEQAQGGGAYPSPIPAGGSRAVNGSDQAIGAALGPNGAQVGLRADGSFVVAGVPGVTGQAYGEPPLAEVPGRSAEPLKPSDPSLLPTPAGPPSPIPVVQSAPAPKKRGMGGLVALVCVVALIAGIAWWSAGSGQDTSEPGASTVATYAVSFEGGDGATGAMDTMSCDDGESITLPSCSFEREGYEFSRWGSSTGTYYEAGDRVRVTKDLTFTAQWEELVEPVDYEAKASQLTVDKSEWERTSDDEHVVLLKVGNGSDVAVDIVAAFTYTSASGDTEESTDVAWHVAPGEGTFLQFSHAAQEGDSISYELKTSEPTGTHSLKEGNVNVRKLVETDAGGLRLEITNDGDQTAHVLYVTAFADNADREFMCHNEHPDAQLGPGESVEVTFASFKPESFPDYSLYLFGYV